MLDIHQTDVLPQNPEADTRRTLTGKICNALCAEKTDMSVSPQAHAAAARAKELKGKGISARDIGKMIGVSRATVYRYLA
jgi:DNA invertase Pin-like site-specific DNA recombinase